jgi:hypothetical protein
MFPAELSQVIRTLRGSECQIVSHVGLEAQTISGTLDLGSTAIAHF